MKKIILAALLLIVLVHFIVKSEKISAFPIVNDGRVESVDEVHLQVLEHYRKIFHASSILSLLQWDEHTMMPSIGASTRKAQGKFLSGEVLHPLTTSASLRHHISLLKSFEKNHQLNQTEKRMLELLEFDYIQNNLPKELVQQSAELTSEGFQNWKIAREKDDFSIFKPSLMKWVSVKKEIAKSIDPSGDVYDTLMHQYDMDISRKLLDPLFEMLKNVLIPKLQKYHEDLEASLKKRGKTPGKILPLAIFQERHNDFKFDVEKQEKVVKKLTLFLGMDENKSRLDKSPHPMTKIMSPVDVRITTIYNASDFYKASMATLHEFGHLLYEQQLNYDISDGFVGPLDRPLGLTTHESQSLFWERHIGLSPVFHKKLWKWFIEEFPELDLQRIPYEDVSRYVNRIRKSSIRLDADEVSYVLHIIVRYEIEKELFDGLIDVDELPRMWNQKMERYLGVKPTSISTGILQDVHFSLGFFGYFPTYLTGQIMASQLYKAISKEMDLNERIEMEDLGPVKEWLKRNIHLRGSRYPLADLLRLAVGEELNVDVFLKYLLDKHGL